LLAVVSDIYLAAWFTNRAGYDWPLPYLGSRQSEINIYGQSSYVLYFFHVGSWHCAANARDEPVAA